MRSRFDDRRLITCLADSDDDVRAAQQLRYRVFAEELGARLGSEDERLDRDHFDPHCDHLLVRDRVTGEVIGTYRILPGLRTGATGGFYAATEFVLGAIANLPGLVEIGRACVDPAYRNGIAIRLLWAGLARYLIEGGYAYVIGCASMAVTGGARGVSAVHRLLTAAHQAPPPWRVSPRRPFPLVEDGDDRDPAVPPLIKGYLRMGAWICGAPAWDPEFGSADFPMLLSMARMRDRYASRLLRAA